MVFTHITFESNYRHIKNPSHESGKNVMPSIFKKASRIFMAIKPTSININRHQLFPFMPCSV